jgi:5-methylcytosine-specific restriction endonuclease McrA
MLGDGRFHLSGIAKLAPHLTESNRDELLARAAHKSKRQIEELIVEMKPKPDVPTVVRKLPQRRSPAPSASRTEPVELRPDGVGSQTTSTPVPQPAKPVEPLAPSRYKVQFTADAALHEKLRRLCALTGSPDLAAAIDQAVTEKLERLEARRFAKTEKPRQKVEEADTTPSSRHIPAAIRRAVWQRDGGRCSFVDEHGKRCTERDRLEFHHQRAFARGGDHSADNISLMCKAHNLLLAEEEYGTEFMNAFRGRGDRVSEPQPVYGMPVLGLKSQGSRFCPKSFPATLRS